LKLSIEALLLSPILILSNFTIKHEDQNEYVDEFRDLNELTNLEAIDECQTIDYGRR